MHTVHGELFVKDFENSFDGIFLIADVVVRWNDEFCFAGFKV